MKNGRNILKFLCVLCLLQILLTAYLILKVYVSNVMRPDMEGDGVRSNPYYNPDFDAAEGFVLEGLLKKTPKELGKGIGREVLKVDDENSKAKLKRPTIEIWAKAALGSYLWEHILGETKSVDPQNPSIYSAQLTTPRCRLNYKEGPGLRMESISPNITHLVLVLNGRTPEKVLISREWLERVEKATPRMKVILVMLGNERCENEWIKRFLTPRGALQGIFLTYDDPSVNNRTIFQWPLGVATYRHFPPLTQTQVNPSQPRKFLCNLQATNYPNSSRSTLFALLGTSHVARERCVVKERTEWAPSETPQSSEKYVSVLLQSDLTLCPAGYNTETYRVYESIAAGSVPVVENTPSGGSCDPKEGWRLLKSFHAPVIWVDRWDELPSILEKEAKMTLGEKSRRRNKLLNWYEWFNFRNRDRLFSFLHDLL